MVGDRLPSTGFRCSAIRTGRVLRWALRPGEMGCSQYGAQPNILLGRWLVQKMEAGHLTWENQRSRRALYANQGNNRSKGIRLGARSGAHL